MIRRYLYSLTDKLNGKIYIGSTDSLYNRCAQYRSRSKDRKSILFDRLREIGFDNFSMVVLCEGPEEYIRYLEEKAIRSFDSMSPNGYNMVRSSRGGAALGRKVPYNGRKVIHNGVCYDSPYEAADATGLTVHSIRGLCKRESRGFRWQ